jgi:hypothetical protein
LFVAMGVQNLLWGMRVFTGTGNGESLNTAL